MPGSARRTTRFRENADDGRWAVWCPVPYRGVPPWIVYSPHNPASWRRVVEAHVYGAGWSDAELAPTPAPGPRAGVAVGGGADG